MNTQRILILLLALGILPAAFADSLESIASAREAKLAEAVEELKTLRNHINEGQIPLALRQQRLDQAIAAKETEVARIQKLRDTQDVELDELEKRLQRRREELDYIAHTLLPEHFANFDASLSPGERSSFGETVRTHNLFLEDPEADEATRLQQSLSLLQMSFGQLTTVLGGKRYPGSAVNQEGHLVDGYFIQVGPLLYFSDQSNTHGWVDEESTSHASTVSLKQSLGQQIAEVSISGKGHLPVDPSLGDALTISMTRDSPLEHLRKGGIWVYPILLFALAATVVALLKIVQIYRIREPRPTAIHEIVKALRAGDVDSARTLAKSQPPPSRGMLVAAVDHASESVEMVEEVMYESMLTTQPRLERWLNVIAVTAATAPLLGLLGTVTGIIKTFRLMTVFGAGDPKPLISGISEALITTELGLVLAIPALVLHAILSRKVAGIMARLEKTSVAFINSLSRKSLTPPTAQ